MGVSGQCRTSAALYPRGEDPRTGGWVGPRAGLDTGWRKNSLALPGIEPQSPSCPVHSQTIFTQYMY
jgi:hypothetical protein